MSTHIATGAVGRPRDLAATETILSETLRLLAARGYAGMSTAHVAAAARVSKATVYRRWPTKFALVAAAIRQGLRQAASAPQMTGEPREDLARVLASKMRALSEGPLGGAIRAVVSHAAYEPELSDAMRAITDEARDHGPLRPLVEEARRQGLIAPTADTGLMLDLLLGAPFFQLLARQTAPDPEQAGALIDLILIPPAPSP